MIDIATDGEITENEISDFLRITNNLEDMLLTIESLKLWFENAITSKKTDKSLLK